MRISNGNFLDEDGNEVNLVELLRTGKATPVVNNNDGHHMSAHSGWFTDENGTPVNIIALINAAIDEDGGDDEPAIGGISVNGGNVVTPDENGIINLTISGDGSTVIDSELSASSTNPVQNRVVTGEINSLNESVTELNGSLDTFSDYFVDSPNLFNPDDADIVLDSEITQSGAIQTKTGFFVSGYIPVRAGQTICCHYPTGTYGSSSKLITYNANKERIGYKNNAVERLLDTNGKQYIRYTFNSDETAVYFRVVGYIANMPAYMYVYASEMLSVYTPYAELPMLAEGIKVDAKDLIGLQVTRSQTDFIKSKPKNLVDLGAVTEGYAIGNNGVAESASGWIITDFIPVEAGKTYALKDYIGVYKGSSYGGIPSYDEDGVFVTKIVPNEGTAIEGRTVTLTIPNNNAIKFIRTCYRLTAKTNHKNWWITQIFEGTDYMEAYTPYDGDEKLQGAGITAEYSGGFNPLAGKLAIWDGDSICAADNDPNGGWAQTIAKKFGMSAKNYGIAGGTIAEGTGSNVHQVSANLDTLITEYPNADYIIIEGGTNDADLLGDAGLGSFDADDYSDAYIEGLVKTTFSGALESIFYRLVTQMPGTHIGYLIPQKMGHTEVLVTRRRAFFDRAIQICQKWGIPYLDLWNGLYFNWRLSAHWDQTKTSAENNEAGNLYRDGQHLTDRGYEIQSPIIGEWLKTI